MATKVGVVKRSISFPKKVFEELNDFCESNERKVSTVVSKAVGEYLENQKKNK